MNRTKTVLTGIDFSYCSGDALRQAHRVAAWNRAELHAIFVVDVPAYQPAPHPLIPFPLPTQVDLAEEARARWPKFAAECGVVGTRFTVAVGNPRSEILSAVEAMKPDLLVLGTHSHSDRDRGIGTTAAGLLRRAETKVLLVREGHRGPVVAIAAFVDFSPTSLEALDQAVRVAAEDGAALHIVHLYDDPWKDLRAGHVVATHRSDFAAKMSRGVEDQLREFCRPLGRETEALKATFHGVQHDQRWEGQGRGIAGFVRRHAVGLAVLGVRSSWNVRDFVVGSTAERVCRDAGCSILTVRPVRAAD